MSIVLFDTMLTLLVALSVATTSYFLIPYSQPRQIWAPAADPSEEVLAHTVLEELRPSISGFKGVRLPLRGEVNRLEEARPVIER